MQPQRGMLQTPAHSDEVRSIFAELDDEAIERITSTGASIEEIGEALSRIERPMPTPPSSGPVAEVCSILRDVIRAS